MLSLKWLINVWEMNEGSAKSSWHSLLLHIVGKKKRGGRWGGRKGRKEMEEAKQKRRKEKEGGKKCKGKGGGRSSRGEQWPAAANEGTWVSCPQKTGISHRTPPAAAPLGANSLERRNTLVLNFGTKLNTAFWPLGQVELHNQGSTQRGDAQMEDPPRRQGCKGCTEPGQRAPGHAGRNKAPGILG